MSDFNENKTNEVENDINVTENINTEATVTKHRPRQSGFLTTLIDYVEIFAIALCVVIVLFSFAFRTCTVEGSSMNNTLLDGEVLIVSDLFYTPERGDIIVFHQTGDAIWDKNEPLVKRVIGVGGDTVRINFNTWEITVTDKDGEVTTLDEPYIYIDPSRTHALKGVHEFDVPEGSLFVLGDNRHNSMDSTDQLRIGFVDSRRVLGRVITRVSPISKFGSVN